jgi:hypothetical protein
MISNNKMVLFMNKVLLLQIMVLSLLLLASPTSAKDVYHVNINNGNDENDGLKWSTAFKNIQPAINIAKTGDTIKVSRGTYHPTEKIADTHGGGEDPSLPTDNYDRSFLLKKDLCLYGGFPANATDATTMNNRDWKVNQTILSGDFNNNDGANFENTSENALHVVVMINASSSMLIDGFYITGGNAEREHAHAVYVNDVLVENSKGGGIYAMTSFSSYINSSPVLSNLVIKNNKAEAEGGGIYNYSNGGNASPTLTNVTIINNIAGEEGGGFLNNGLKSSNPKLSNVIISGNKAMEGGGFSCIAEEECSPILENVLISGNKANLSGGIFIFAMGANASPVITNTTICGNYAFDENDEDDYGVGGMYILAGGSASPVIKNTVIWGNKSAIEEADNLYLTSKWGGTNPVYSNSLIGGLDPGGTNLKGDTDPKFVNHIKAESAPTVSVKGDYRLTLISPLINRGNNDDISLLYDLDSHDRIFGNSVDIGAFELQQHPDLTNNETMTGERSIWSYQGNLFVKVRNNQVTVNIFSINGMMIRQINNPGEGTHTITLPEGFYIVTLSTGEKAKIYIRKK